MLIIPELSLGIQNCWWFTLIYGILSLSIMATIPEERRKRILTFPRFNSKFEKITSEITLFLFGRGLILFTIFIPLKLWTIHFYIGTVIYLIGMILSVYALYTFSKAELSKPVITGMFKITRHPIQVMAIIMWIGIGIASGSLILIICAVLYTIIAYPSFNAAGKVLYRKIW